MNIKKSKCEWVPKKSYIRGLKLVPSLQIQTLLLLWLFTGWGWVWGRDWYLMPRLLILFHSLYLYKINTLLDVLPSCLKTHYTSGPRHLSALLTLDEELHPKWWTKSQLMKCWTHQSEFQLSLCSDQTKSWIQIQSHS